MRLSASCRGSSGKHGDASLGARWMPNATQEQTPAQQQVSDGNDARDTTAPLLPTSPGEGSPLAPLARLELAERGNMVCVSEHRGPPTCLVSLWLPCTASQKKDSVGPEDRASFFCFASSSAFEGDGDRFTSPEDGGPRHPAPRREAVSRNSLDSSF